MDVIVANLYGTEAEIVIKKALLYTKYGGL